MLLVAGLLAGRQLWPLTLLQLIFSAGNGLEAAVRVLLAAERSVNQREPDGTTAIEAAHNAGHTAVVHMLLRAGARL